MHEIILHHYDLSPYAEKIRLALGRKALTWRSVATPMVMPKPDHVELTGGYRRVPVLQIGADVYCDTHCIARALDRLFPDPPLSPPGQQTLEHAFSRWAETTFMMGVLALFGIGGAFSEEFMEDRRKTMVPPGANLEQTRRRCSSRSGACPPGASGCARSATGNPRRSPRPRRSRSLAPRARPPSKASRCCPKACSSGIAW
jgi:glutathione S-transferase